MAGRPELAYAANHRGAKDSGSNIGMFSGAIATRSSWNGLSVLFHFLNNRMCGLDNEMVRVTSMTSLRAERGGGSRTA